MRNFLLVLITSHLLLFQTHAFEPDQWQVRCWDKEKKLWTDRGVDAFTISQKKDSATLVTNSSAIHKHAHFVLDRKLEGDFTFQIKLKGGYELGFLNREGKDEMLYLEIEEVDTPKFHTYELSRVGTRYTITRDGRTIPLVHFRFDYSDEVMITLAQKEGKSATIESVHFTRNP